MGPTEQQARQGHGVSIIGLFALQKGIEDDLKYNRLDRIEEAKYRSDSLLRRWIDTVILDYYDRQKEEVKDWR